MKKQELINKYFQGTIEPNEMIEFERLLIEDDSFKAQFELEKQTKKAIISIKKDELNAVFKKIEKEAPKKKSISVFWAASIVIALGLLTVFMINNNETDHNELYTEYFEVYPNIIAPPVRGVDSISKIQKDFMPYERNDFRSASRLFEKRFNETNAPYYLFYQGVSELKLENIDKAISIFNKHKTYQDRFEQYSSWYLALAYLKLNELKKSKVLLSEIVAKETFNYKKAKALLNELE